MQGINIQFGTLRDIFGNPKSAEGFTIVPAWVELRGNQFSNDFYLKDAVVGSGPAILAGPIKKHYDAAWVRARLPNVFGFTPEKAEAEKALLDVGFVAVASGSTVGIPFVCIDYYGKTGLMFSPEGPDKDTQANIAHAFWSLLLESPEDVSDFHEKVFHPGACVWMHFSCVDGEPGYEESD